MYTALLILFGGIALGRLFRAHISRNWTQRLISASIFLLLFFLGVSIGKNSGLLAQLPVFGLQALALMLMGVGGSIACCLLIRPLFSEKTQCEKNRAMPDK